jgi:peptidoglycan/xylan/chitin deacetylase (PgdA/CDA1 family)
MAQGRYESRDNRDVQSGARSQATGQRRRTTHLDTQAPRSATRERTGRQPADATARRERRSGYENRRDAEKRATDQHQRRSAPPIGVEPRDESRPRELNRRNSHNSYDPMAQRRSNSAVIVTAIVLLSALAIFIVFWTHRPISITVDGSDATVQVGSSLASIAKARHVSVKPGDFVSVSGDVLTEGEGEPFSAKVNGSDLSHDQMASYKARSHDSIEFDDGADITEDYDVQIQEQQPVLKMEGGYGAVSYVKQWGQVGKTELRTGKVSGTTAEGDTLQEVQDCIIEMHNVKPDNNQKLVALTFDDGPAETYTEQYLDILAKYDAKATFFFLGDSITEHPDLAKRVADAGMQVCSHTDTHQDLTTLSSSKLREEIGSTFSTIKDATGVETTTIRPPYGSFKEKTWLDSQGTISASIIWNMDSGDWRLQGSESIVANATSGIQPGYIILMHDGGGDRSQDVEALPQILQTLQAQGYRFVTLSELLSSDSSIPADVASGNATMPEGAVWPTQISAEDLEASSTSGGSDTASDSSGDSDEDASSEESSDATSEDEGEGE